MTPSPAAKGLSQPHPEEDAQSAVSSSWAPSVLCPAFFLTHQPSPYEVVSGADCGPRR